ncbi:GPX-like protein [Mya arenaria]|uniref:GPX-like protein n=1 Tax=Mya arenaria TaxID=6604 RepID=A0ABY7E2M2_MYAAR|nr:GPX-like protein [Mya arenaria]
MFGESALRALLTVASLVGGAVGAGNRDGVNPRQVCNPSTGNETAYDFQFFNVYNNETFDMAQFRGKLTLAVNQEPAWNGVELMNGINHVRPGNGFVPNFPLTWKIQSLCAATTRMIVTPALYSPVFMEDIRWNYEKFLIGPDGRPIYRYGPDVDPAIDVQMHADIRAQLAKMKNDPVVG